MAAMFAFAVDLAMTPETNLAAADLNRPLAIDLSRAARKVCAARGFPANASLADTQGFALVILRHPDSAKPPLAARAGPRGGSSPSSRGLHLA